MRAVRWFIIRIAEIFILLIVILITLASAASGYVSVQWMQMQGTAPFNIGPGVGAAIGGLVGFITMAVFSATFFLLIEIANNTRRTVTFFEHVLDRNGHE